MHVDPFSLIGGDLGFQIMGLKKIVGSSRHLLAGGFINIGILLHQCPMNHMSDTLMVCPSCLIFAGQHSGWVAPLWSYNFFQSSIFRMLLFLSCLKLASYGVVKFK
jgi:hypothetical protein